MKNTFFLLLIAVLWSCDETKNPERDSTTVKTSTSEQKATETVLKEDSLLTSLNKKIRADINNKDFYLQRAQYFQDIGAEKEAMGDIGRAFTIDSVYLPTLLMQADFLATKGRLEGSENILHKANRLYPQNSEIHAKYSKVYLIGKDNTKSLKFADLAIKYDIYNEEAYYLKGFNFYELGDTTKAISSYRTAIEQNPDYFEPYLQLGLIFSKQSNPLALEYFSNALEVKQNDKITLYSKGMYEQEHEMFNEALTTYQQAVDAYPDFKEAYYNTGYIHLFYLKLFRESQTYFTEAIKIDDRYIQAYYNRGYAFELLGDLGNAEKDYRYALSLDPTYDLAAEGLSRLKQ